MDNTTIHIGEMLDREARMYPNDIALVERMPAKGRRLEITWKAFDEKANRFTNILRERGVGKGDRVVHLMMNSIDWLIACSGSLEAEHGLCPSISVLMQRISNDSEVNPHRLN